MRAIFGDSDSIDAAFSDNGGIELPKPKTGMIAAIVAAVALCCAGLFALMMFSGEGGEPSDDGSVTTTATSTEKSSTTKPVPPATEPTEIPSEVDAAPIIEEFLMSFPTIFTDTVIPVANGYNMQRGQYRWWWWCEIENDSKTVVSLDTPDFYFDMTDAEDGMYINAPIVDRFGRVVNENDNPWISGYSYATGWLLLDFFDDGIPAIIISYYGNGAGNILYRFIDGEYRRVPRIEEVSEWNPTGFSDTIGWFISSYYLDEDGNLVTLSSGPGGGYTYNRITFNSDNIAEIEQIFNDYENRPDSIDWEDWEKWEEWYGLFDVIGEWDDDWNTFTPKAHTIPTTQIALTPAVLTSLHREIDTTVRQKFATLPQINPKPQLVTMRTPDLVGYTERNLALGNIAADYKINLITYRDTSYSEDFDVIIRQNPAPGTEMGEWDTVMVWLGDGSLGNYFIDEPTPYDYCYYDEYGYCDCYYCWP
jgi:hypothetical protein